MQMLLMRMLMLQNLATRTVCIQRILKKSYPFLSPILNGLIVYFIEFD